MLDRDLDLVAALAEGTLQDETEARALIATDDEARLEYEAQKRALEALAMVSPATMSDTERAAIHRDVWTELTTGAATETSTKTHWYYRWAGVAASLFVVVGIGAVILQNADPVVETFSEIGSSLGGADSTVAAAGEAEPTSNDQLADDGGASRSAAPPQATEEQFADHASKLRDGSFTSFLARSESQDESDLQSCVNQSPELAGYIVIGVLPSPTEFTAYADAAPTLIAASPADADLSTATIAFVDPETCEMLYLDE